MDERQQGFLAWLGRLEADIQQMQSLLEQECEVLRTRRLDELSSLAQAKQETVVRIDERLGQLPTASGPKETVIEQLFEALKLRGVPDAWGVWDRIRTATARCRELNEANGAMIALLNEQTRQALGILFGQRHQPVCYGADGQSRTESGARLLGES
ncbi:flagella synthesis protein FlgN [Methylomarinovum tepidoasis]|uniref:Flagella synthesis protein FlgN n=1 Tax=Methylomarinovum tepidoasis TaxID=2840183 RepID=A0AAU9C2U7_9GAMM|nr:flagellar protein FlgN [Methylomarinovum sp. IN45]BCX87687.1 flagella synthesis protein FlgN [Methylomarinovum sp. IN45]